MMKVFDKKILNILAAFFGCWALQLTFGITARNPLTVVLFVGLYLIRERNRCFVFSDKQNPLILIGASAMSVIIGAAASFLMSPARAAAFTSGVFKLLVAAILFVGYFCLSNYVMDALFILAGKKSRASDGNSLNGSGSSDHEEYTDSRRRTVFFSTFAVCILFYLPYFLYEFPGIMTADPLVQYQQIIGIMGLSNHHPVVHTLLIKLFYSIGMSLTHDPVTSLAFYTVFQMVFLAFSCAVAVREIFLVTGFYSPRLHLLCLFFYAFLPFNAVFSVTMWKDVPFAAITVLLVCHMISMCRKSAEGVGAFDFALFGLLGILFSLFRSNAFYAFVAFAPVFIYYFRKRFRQALVTAVISVVIVCLVKGPLFDSMKVTGPDFTESLSLPLQQIARVLVDDRSISEKDISMIDDVIDRTYIKELYAPGYADNIKELVRAGRPEKLEESRPEYFKLWIRQGMENPAEYLAAWYDLEGGYIYPDVDYRVADADGIMGNDLGLYPRPIIGGKFIKVKEILIKVSDFMPLYGMFFSIGAYFWALVIAMAVSIWKRRNVLVHIQMMLLVLTLLIAAPVVDFRYGYALVLTFPVWTVMSFLPDKRSGKNDK